MVEKINRLKIKGCERELEDMVRVLRASREEFMGGEYIFQFEKEWVLKYL
jgi:hypothetical protein